MLHDGVAVVAVVGLVVVVAVAYADCGRLQ